jgi:hypothetical protein
MGLGGQGARSGLWTVRQEQVSLKLAQERASSLYRRDIPCGSDDHTAKRLSHLLGGQGARSRSVLWTVRQEQVSLKLAQERASSLYRRDIPCGSDDHDPNISAKRDENSPIDEQRDVHNQQLLLLFLLLLRLHLLLLLLLLRLEPADC